jgi:hypothetical protein
MNWQVASVVADILAAVAVVFSVFYLAIQIRRNTVATFSQTHYLTTAALSQDAATMASSADLSRVYRIGLSYPNKLDEDESFRFALIATSQFRTFENLYFQHRAGLVDEDFWDGHRENILWFYHRPGMQAWWKEKRLGFSTGFREFLESSTLAELESPSIRRV